MIESFFFRKQIKKEKSPRDKKNNTDKICLSVVHEFDGCVGKHLTFSFELPGSISKRYCNRVKSYLSW